MTALSRQSSNRESIPNFLLSGLDREHQGPQAPELLRGLTEHLASAAPSEAWREQLQQHPGAGLPEALPVDDDMALLSKEANRRQPRHLTKYMREFYARQDTRFHHASRKAPCSVAPAQVAVAAQLVRSHRDHDAIEACTPPVVDSLSQHALAWRKELLQGQQEARRRLRMHAPFQRPAPMRPRLRGASHTIPQPHTHFILQVPHAPDLTQDPWPRAVPPLLPPGRLDDQGRPLSTARPTRRAPRLHVNPLQLQVTEPASAGVKRRLEPSVLPRRPLSMIQMHQRRFSTK